ncbi:hypothetical protein KKG65_00365 [Patescibacteria group bacterium]|nr:hypothetical protein [Patescibacteria group bacterium]
MTLKQLGRAIETPIFYSYQVERLFFNEGKTMVNTQLSRLTKRGELVRLKRGVYKFADRELDDFVLAGWLYKPSYVSLESALQVAGIIPDVVGQITSVTTVTSKEIKTSVGMFLYSKLAKNLYFGYRKIKDEKSGLFYNMAEPEKALLDWIYIRGIRGLESTRVNRDDLNKKKLKDYSKIYPEWVRKVLYE